MSGERAIAMLCISSNAIHIEKQICRLDGADWPPGKARITASLYPNVSTALRDT